MRALEEIPDKQKNLVFERLIIYFLVKNREEIEYIFYYLNNGMFRIMEIYLENEDKFFIENIEHYINLHAFFICILEKLDLYEDVIIKNELKDFLTTYYEIFKTKISLIDFYGINLKSKDHLYLKY